MAAGLWHTEMRGLKEAWEVVAQAVPKRSHSAQFSKAEVSLDLGAMRILGKGFVCPIQPDIREQNASRQARVVALSVTALIQYSLNIRKYGWGEY